MNKNRFFTVVYEVPDDWRPGDDIMHNPMMTSVSWSHALRDRDEALARAGIAAPTGQQAEPVAMCGTCGGRGFVEDGEIDCYSNGEPFECGPVRCVKDCPNCKPAAPVSAAPAAPTSELTAYLVESFGIGYYHAESHAAIIARKLAAPTAAVKPSLDAEEMTRLRRLMRALDMADDGRNDAYVRGLLFTVLGQAAGRIEATQREGTSEQDADPARCDNCADFGCDECSPSSAAMSAAQAQPKDTTDTRRDA